MKTTPILVLTGYLGSGKTTLLNYILQNEQGIRFAVIVNDLGEVNIDADLIQKGGIVGQGDDSLVALQNGCICCTLKADLMKQIEDLVMAHTFDYIVIEASGICEPEPIAQTICTMQQMSRQQLGYEFCHLDCVCTVVDALRMQSEFACGDDLQKKHIDDEDIENLVIQQIEFCNVVLLNKASEVSPAELEHIRQIVRALNAEAKIITCDYAKVDLNELLDTNAFNYREATFAATWVKEFEKEPEDLPQPLPRSGDDHHDHHKEDHHDHPSLGGDGGGHHHHHDHPSLGGDGGGHDEGEAEEYGISTFVYYRRQAFDLNKFDHFVNAKWSKNIIRSKGICYFSNNRDMSYMFEQAGVQKKLVECGYWLCTATPEELRSMAERDPSIMRDFDDYYGDRMQKLVFIGQKMDQSAITSALDDCLVQD